MVEKIEKLTEDQEALIPVVRDEWLNRFFNAPAPNPSKIAEGVNWLYKLAEIEVPLTVLVDSPFAAQLVANWIGAINDNHIEETIRANPNFSEPTDERNDYWLMTARTVTDLTTLDPQEPNKLLAEFPLMSVVWRALKDAVAHKIKNLFEIGIGVPLQLDKFVNPYEDQLRHKLYNDCIKAFAEVKLGYLDFAYHFNCMDYHWTAFYDFFTRIGVVNHAPFNEYMEYLKAGVYESIQLQGTCIASFMPKAIHRDAQNRLHNVAGPAIEWYDGYKLFYIDGVYFEDKLFQSITKGTITPKEIFELKNTEQKTIAMKVYGYDKMLADVGSKVLDTRKLEVRGKEIEYQLIEADLQEGNSIIARFVKVVCHTTFKETLLRVNPEDPRTKTVMGAIASCVDMTEAEYLETIALES